MDRERSRQNASLEGLLEAGKQAYTDGDREAAHELWRSAAVANPYDERVWVALLDVLTQDEDREVCLENIIAINPLNPDARRQLRTIRRERRIRDEAAQQQAEGTGSRKRRQRKASITPLPRQHDPAIVPLSNASPSKAEARPRKRRSSFVRAILTGVGIGLLAVVLGVAVSVIVYGGILSTAAL